MEDSHDDRSGGLAHYYAVAQGVVTLLVSSFARRDEDAANHEKDANKDSV